jgi:hypothetical protein
MPRSQMARCDSSDGEPHAPQAQTRATRRIRVRTPFPDGCHGDDQRWRSIEENGGKADRERTMPMLLRR